MDRQHAAAEPEQRDEYATEWAHRELNTMPIAVTQTNTPQAMLPIDGRDTLNSFPTSANRRDISHSTSWMTFQPYQQRAGFIGCDHGQGSGLPEEVQQELAEAELRHTVARYEILEKAKAFSSSSHSRIIDAPYMDPVIGSTITDYGGESGPSNALMHSHQLFNHGPMPNDSGSMRDFNLGVWPTQQIPDTAFDLNPSQNGVHDPNQMSITLPDIHVDDPSAPYQAMYREPFTETSLLPRTPPYDRMISILDTGDHGNNVSFSEATNHCRNTESVLTPQGVGSVAVDTDILEIHQIDDAAYNITSPLTVPPWNGNIASRQGHPFVAVSSGLSPGLSPYPTIEQSATSYVDAVETAAPLLHSQTMTVVSGTVGDQLPIAKRKICDFNNVGNDKTVCSRALDNIYFHTNPEADRERQKHQPKRRRVTTKASWSCFGCRLNKRKCETSIDGLCLRCKDILNKNAYRTPVQKFTCNVRTKFVDFAYSCFTDVPDVSDYIRLLLESDFAIKRFGSTLPRNVDSTKRSQEAMNSMICELVERLRSFLDFMEPLHVRQFLPRSSPLPVLWSYSLSIIKWQKVIGSLWPGLKDDLYFHKEYHMHMLRPISLHLLDHMEYLGDYVVVALLLNVWYEEISAMDKNLMTSSSVKDHLQSSLADRILHIYRSLFPTSTTGKASRTKEMISRAVVLRLFPSTIGLLPSHYRRFSMGDIARNMLQHWKTSICSDENLPSGKTESHCQKPPEHSFPMLKAYVPVQLFVILGLDTETEDVTTNLQWMEPIEMCIQKHLKIYDANVQKEILDLSPYTLSIGTKALFFKVDKVLTDEGLVNQAYSSWDCSGRKLLHGIVAISVGYCKMLISCVQLLALSQKREVTLAEFVMENRDLEDKYFQVLVDGSESSRARLYADLFQRFGLRKPRQRGHAAQLIQQASQQVQQEGSKV
ncbi:unnamed protein product [Alternaria burnsii]|nr:unnamed protein product [Alternaria burnsii]